jgi:hypothetical protein
MALLHGADYMPASFLVQTFPPHAAAGNHNKKAGESNRSAGQIP